MKHQTLVLFLFEFVLVFCVNSNQDGSEYTIYSDLKEIVILDEEWYVKRNKSIQDELPLAVMNIYESFVKNVSTNDFISSLVKCHFDKSTNSHLGLYIFDLNEYEKNQEIIDAELHIYISCDVINSSSTISYDYLVIRVYQIVPTNFTDMHETLSNPDLHKLLHVAYMPSYRQGWQIFKIKMTVEKWINSEANLGLLITVNDKRETRIFPNFLRSSNGIYRPFLLIYSGARENTGTRNSIKKYKSNCKKQEWNVDFKEIGWDNFIIQPKILKAGRCSGSCTSVNKTETSPYTYLYKNLFKYTFNNEKINLYCVPTSFYSIPLMFYNKVDDVVIKIYDDLIVDYCECR